MTDTNPDAQAASPVYDLIRQREQLRNWLSKLGEVATGSSSRVADRVRQDYEDRLRRVNEELSLFRDEIDRDLEALRGELTEAEQRRAQASEVLEEARLRHMIGELDDDEWSRQEERLQGDAEAAAAEAERAQAEVDRLSALATEVVEAGSPPEPEALPEPEPEAAPEQEPASELEEPAAEAAPEEQEDADVASWLEQLSAATSEAPAEPGPEGEDTVEDAGDLPWLEAASEQPKEWSPESEPGEGLEFLDGLDKPAPETPESLADDDLAFLEELDRAISGSAAPRAATPPPSEAPATPPPAEGSAAPDRQSGGPLLCKECGAINEPHSWYCEVCGSEL